MMWAFTNWFPYEVGLKVLAEKCDIKNRYEIEKFKDLRAGQFYTGSMPLLQLEIRDEEFRVDCFTYDLLTFVSERMRDALNINGCDIQYFEVDTSLSCDIPRSMNYKIMNIPCVESVSDATNSIYQTIEIPGVINHSSHIVESIKIRSEVNIKRQLFYDEFFRSQAFCTETLAIRVLRAGCTGVRFFDPAQLSMAKPMRFRTLRGIEEEGEWDSLKMVEHTRLIQAIN